LLIRTFCYLSVNSIVSIVIIVTSIVVLLVRFIFTTMMMKI